MQYSLKTERLHLAPSTNVGLDQRVALANNINVARMVAGVPHPYTRKDAQEWVASHDAGRAAGTDFPFAITLKGDGLIGAVGLHKKGAALFDLGYWLGGPDFRAMFAKNPLLC